MNSGEKDIAGVIARPPLILLIALVAAVICDYLFPAGHIARMSTGLRYLAAGSALLAGIALLGAAANEMRSVETNIPTWEPTLALATGGVYGYSRNPIYLAFALGIVAFGLFFASDWAFVMLIPFALVIHFGVVLREERYLLKRFGAPYANYMARVPRYFLGI